MNGPYDGGWALGMIFMSLLFLALLVGGIVLIVRSSSSRDRASGEPDGNRALDILDERFARGELDKQEYEERRRILTGRK